MARSRRPSKKQRARERRAAKRHGVSVERYRRREPNRGRKRRGDTDEADR
jgi:hypothetical protein